MKQGVQLILERVQRHRAFPRLAGANGQNLPTTLSLANTPAPVGSRLERPRFIAVLAEPDISVLAEPGISRVQDQSNLAPNFETRDEINALYDDTALEAERVLMPETEFSAQEFENTSSQASEPTLELEPVQGSDGEHDPQTLSDNAAPEISASVLPAKALSEPALKTPPLRVAPEQAEVVKTQQASQQDSGTQAREAQATPSATRPTPTSGTSQSETRETLAANQTDSNVEAVQTPEFVTPQAPRFEANSEQDISLKPETDQIENTNLNSEQVPILTPDTLFASQNPNRGDVKQTSDSPVETQLESTTSQLEQPMQPVRGPSRLESTLEALRQFHPKQSESAAQADAGLWQSTQPNPRAIKTSGAQQTTQPEASSNAKPAISQKSSEPSLEKSTVSRAESTIETANPSLSTIQTSKVALETQAVTRTDPAHAEAFRIESAELEAVPEFIQAEPTTDESLPSDDARAFISRPIAGNSLESGSSENPQESLQAEASRVAATQADLPQVQPDLKPESASNQRPAPQNTQDVTETSSDARPTSSVLATPSRVQEPFSEQVPEREAYQRSVMLRAERAKRALAAKEELERDPTLDEPQTSQTPASGEARHDAAPVQSSLEPEPETKITPSLEPALEPRSDTVMAEAGNPDAFTQNPQVTDSSIAVESDQQLAEDNPRHQSASNLENSNQTTIISASESPTANSSERQPSNSDEFQAINSDEIQILDSANTPASNPSQAATVPNQDLPASFLKTEGVNVYNPQRRIQRTIPTPPAKPKREPNEAEKLFAEMPEISEQEILQMIRKAQGQATPVKNQKPASQSENTLVPQNTQTNTNARVEQAANLEPRGGNPEMTTQALDASNLSLAGTQTSHTAQANARASEPQNAAAVAKELVQRNPVDAQGNKIHVFNPPNRRTVPPKPKIEQPKTEAERLFETMEVTETPEELFQRVVKNRLNPNLEPPETELRPNLNTETTASSTDVPTPGVNQALKPNLPNPGSRDSSDQTATNLSVTGSPSVQLSQNARRFLKPIVGIDPNDVKIYRDPQTERLTKAARADALTVGDTILLSSEQNLESPETLGLIAHELTHVARNRQARFVPPVAYSNANLAASAQAGNEEGLALGVEALARQGWTHFNQNANQNTSSQNFSSQTTPNTASQSPDRSSYGGLPAPAQLPEWFLRDGTPPQASAPSAPRSNIASGIPITNSFVPQMQSNPIAASIGAQAAAQGRDLPTPPPAAGPLPASSPPKPEPNPTRAAPDLDAMARQVYTILKRRLANERFRM